MRRRRLLLGCVALGLLLAACGGSGTAVPTFDLAPRQQEGSMSLTLQSTAFDNDQDIPRRYTCDGEDVSPALTWSGRPDNTAAFALIMDDPDAPRGVFTHWIYFDLPRDVREIPEHVPNVDQPDTGGVQGRNDFDKIGYSGPCPPPSSPHHYHFALYALDTPLDLAPGASKQQVLQAMNGHVLAKAETVGLYQRQK